MLQIFSILPPIIRVAHICLKALSVLHVVKPVPLILKPFRISEYPFSTAHIIFVFAFVGRTILVDALTKAVKFTPLELADVSFFF